MLDCHRPSTIKKSLECNKMKYNEMLAPQMKSYGKPRQRIEKQRHHFANKVPSNHSYAFSSSHVQM